MHALDIILRKRDGHELSDTEIQTFIQQVVAGEVTDARIAALLMAIFLRGLTAHELATLTQAMRYSGETFDSTFLNKFTVDKHSTGGVGDKTSLLIAPIVAAAGLADPMISGRSLGHTGGTLDKLETIPGFRTQLSMQEFGEVTAQCGFSMIGQTENLVPADRILYALRDHTGTVESPNLITASIMSKKLASGLQGLVLDVKTGSGAFLKSFEESEHLAGLLVGTGERAGTRTVALLTTMDQPLGRFSGNWVEVWECVEIMRCIAHPLYTDVIELSVTLAGWMLQLGGITPTPEAGRERALELLHDGSVYKKWLEMVKLQGGDATPFADPAAFHQPAVTLTLTASRSGYLSSMDCTEVGWAIQRLGAGREVPDDPVSAHAGIEMHAKLGDSLETGDPLVTLFGDSEEQLATAESMLHNTMKISSEKPTLQPLIRKIFTKQSL
ncbi:thymidine phosphorylase [Terriglobus saanensis]|uniref:thymidine phosphorylase n=1 Tax=Terriglobus saanensis (strain ATCC BAA-1853 / DSM 23119 / SP1PR4) TaxID=401053 RepID=E8V4T8_TERSS|nr:thymidine phosphorylase [Terriglobus saanensis]ADV81492.1 pyrimidine-nucleoside phosphorylase [Terriglobus saanensis SP1PR4]